ncbi:GNAT family N-acetyltransferase [Sandarakinorhabdus oryzae]|uniref:GNAT family N-acetyltransferase n=1 Tax=Sandarakinorhabdus oryzae TaxID=2675220 RepID=UPI0018CBFAFE|nr:GNAT family N-acetyltransferase [Sandarakinorhabdus oryzae]
MIRSLHPSDLPAAKAIIDSVGLFPSELLDDMVAGYFAEPPSGEIWLVVDDHGVKGLAYAAPERMTSGTWNNLLLAVAADSHGRGFGAALLAEVERQLRAARAHLLLVETSDQMEFARTRRFYSHVGYAETGRIADFYQPGEGKVIFVKSLAG